MENWFFERGSEALPVSRTADPCILVIFGATGDLTARKLFPALYNLQREGLLPSSFCCLGVARKAQSSQEFREHIYQAISKFSRELPIDEDEWKKFQECIFYHQGEFDSGESYSSLKKVLSKLEEKYQTKGNVIFYLSTPPSFFSNICHLLHDSGLLTQKSNPWARIIIEKPFGHDFNSAESLQKELRCYLKEKQIYRIDHYLGKETVQNLLVFRFANSLFESLWNNRYIDHVQITVAEDIGINNRGAFYEESGLLRDIVQNHMMQLLSLVAMEPPVNLNANAIRNEKVKVLQSIIPFSQKEFNNCLVRGQYGAGSVKGKFVSGYREEKNVSVHSLTETYVALRLFVDNWRWHGVPFYLRGGKRLSQRKTEIVVVFKHPPDVLFQQQSPIRHSNELVMRIQPNEGIALQINSKQPGIASSILPVQMDFQYGSYFGTSPPEAYERLILDCMSGDPTLFAREDEVLTSWAVFDPVLSFWKNFPLPASAFPNYSSGSVGPTAANELLARDGRTWRSL